MKTKRHKDIPLWMYAIPLALLVLGFGLWLIFKNTASSPTITVKHAANDNAVATGSSTSSVPTLPYHAPVINPDTDVPGGVTQSSTSTTLAAPEGSFVSNHGNTSAGDPAVTSSTQEVSVCSTTPGATCQIFFTQGTQSISLPAESTSTTASKSGEAPGIVSWSWTPGQIDLSQGEWQITATATLSGQSKSTTDPTELTLSQ